MIADDARIGDARSRAILTIAENLEINWMLRGYPERTGHCPVCGGADKPGADRFSLNLQRNVFYCRKCDVGGDPIALVRFVRKCSFVEALDWILGPAQVISKEERQKRNQKAEADARALENQENQFRANAIAAARDVWQRGRAPGGTEVEGYILRRGIDIAALGGFPRCIRFHPALRYSTKESGVWVTHHEGPAMLAAIQGPDGRFCGVHRTWLDLSHAKGKAVIRHRRTGEMLNVKKALGSKKGGAIRLTGDVESEVMVSGEGLETTWSAMMPGVYGGAAFWCLVDKGNMAGRRARGPGLKYAGLPDMGDAKAFVPPPWVRRLIFVMDGDSEPRDTRASMECGLRRAMALRPGLQGQIVAAPNGFDLNDVLMGGGHDRPLDS